MIWFFICGLAFLCSAFLARHLWQDHARANPNANPAHENHAPPSLPPPPSSPPPSLPLTLAVIFIALPFSALALYAYLGNPTLPDHPLAPRLNQPLDRLSEAAILAKLEQRLYSHPDDVQGWRLQARLQASRAMAIAAADSWQQVLRLAPDEREALLGLITALVAGDEGLIGAPAQSLIDRAELHFPTHPMTLYYSGLSARQQGQAALARQLWQKALAALAADDPRHAFITRQMMQIAP